MAKAERLRACLVDQLSALVGSASVNLGVPMESRVKTWESIEEKIGRKSLSIKSLDELPDLVGIRVILLFQRDLSKFENEIEKNLDVFSSENAADRLDEAQFGYQSRHFVVKLRDEWLKIPTYSELGGLAAEIQVRTLAQHIWAAASHKLQYKNEKNVPPPLRRTINRVSALLETVDLEFSRVLEERDAYINTEVPGLTSDTPLDVELVRAIVEASFPAQNGDDVERYDDLLENLFSLGVKTAGELQKVLEKNRDAALRSDAEQVKGLLNSKEPPTWADEARTERGVFFTFCGLCREALRAEFGHSEVNKVLAAQKKPRRLRNPKAKPPLNSDDLLAP